jgi:hypothetical protein
MTLFRTHSPSNLLSPPIEKDGLDKWCRIY